jgi:prevent-host-death family protein
MKIEIEHEGSCLGATGGTGRLIVRDALAKGHSGIVLVRSKARVDSMKVRTITQRELRSQSAAVLREVEAGQTMIVSRNGTPVGELRPIRRRRFVLRAVIADAAGRAARIDAAQFRADLDAVVDPQIDD